MTRNRIALAALVACALLPAPAEAQTAREPPARPRGAASAIPLPRVPKEMARSFDFVTHRSDTVGHRAAFQAISEASRAVLAVVAERRARAESLLAQQPTLRTAEALESEWQERRLRLNERIVEARNFASLLTERALALDSLRAVWNLTKTSHGEALTAARAGGIDSLLLRIDERVTLESGIAERADTLLGDFLVGQATVRDILARIRTVDTEARAAIFARDSPPAWKVARQARGRDFLAEARLGLEESWQIVRDFARREATGLVLLGLLYLGIVTLLLVSRKQVLETTARGPDETVASHLLRRPASAGLLLTALAFRITYPQAPHEVGHFLALLIIVPFLRLSAGIQRAPLRAPIFLLAGLFFLDHAGALLGEQTLGWRLNLLVRSAAGALAFHWVAERLRQGTPGVYSLHPAVVVLVRAGSALLAIGALANLLGFTTLALVLTGGTITSAVLGIVFGMLAPILRGLVLVVTQTPLVTGSRYLHRNTGTILGWTARLTNLGLTALWILVTLDRFRLGKPVFEWLRAILTARIELGEAAISLAGILGFGLTAWLGLTIARVVSGVLEEDILARADLPRGVPAAVGRVTYVILIAIAFVLAAATAGVQLSQVALLTGALGVGIGFGLQGVVNNFFSGLILMFERPVQVGDVVQVGTLMGTVRRVGFRASTIRTFEGASVIVPNANLTSNEVINWTLSDQSRRVDLRVGTAYGTDPKQVIDLLVRTAAAHPSVSKEPAPLALFQEFGDSSLNFVLRYWTNDYSRWVEIGSEVAVAVNAALVEAGIEVPFPQRTLHVASWPGPPSPGSPAS